MEKTYICEFIKYVCKDDSKSIME